MGAAGPATGPPHALLELFLGPADSTVPGYLLLGILDPADELVASERGDIPPCRKRQGALDQRPTKIGRKIVDDPRRHRRTAHGKTVVDQ